AHGVVADWLDVLDADLVLAQLQRFLPWAVAAHFRRRRVDAQVFERQLEARAVVEAHFEQARAGAGFDRGRVRHQRMYRGTSLSFTSSPRCWSTYCASMVTLKPLRSAASNDSTSSRRSSTVCSRPAPMFSVSSLTLCATAATR